MSSHDVIIIGGGPAGLAAAQELRRQGVHDCVVIERETAAGGVPRHCGHRGFGVVEYRRLLTGPDYARRLAAAARDVDLRTRTTVTGLGPAGRVQVVSAAGAATLLAQRVLLATGTRETPRSARLVSGTRPWGVTTTGALQQFVYLAGGKPFERALIIGTELVAFSCVLTLRHAGIRPVAMIEEGACIMAPWPAGHIARLLFGVPVLTATRIVAIHGERRVTGVEIDRGGRREMIACDGVVFTGRFVPEAALLRDSHIAVDAGTGGPVVDQYGRCTDPCYFAAGNLLRPVELSWTAWREGRAAGAAIAASLRGQLPAPARQIAVRAGAPLRYVCPQRISLPAAAPWVLTVQTRSAQPVRGRLRLLADGSTVWSRAIERRPEQRIEVPLRRAQFEHAAGLRIEIVE